LVVDLEDPQCSFFNFNSEISIDGNKSKSESARHCFTDKQLVSRCVDDVANRKGGPIPPVGLSQKRSNQLGVTKLSSPVSLDFRPTHSVDSSSQLESGVKEKVQKRFTLCPSTKDPPIEVTLSKTIYSKDLTSTTSDSNYTPSVSKVVNPTGIINTKNIDLSREESNLAVSTDTMSSQFISSLLEKSTTDNVLINSRDLTKQLAELQKVDSSLYSTQAIKSSIPDGFELVKLCKNEDWFHIQEVKETKSGKHHFLVDISSETERQVLSKLRKSHPVCKHKKLIELEKQNS
jgi:hypothetical protein